MHTHFRTILTSCGIVALLVAVFAQQNHAANNAMLASDEPMMGEIRLVAFNFPPRGWANCDGQLLPISSNTALFSLLGTTYGGDGRTTFALPDLRSRSAVHTGQGQGLPHVNLGQKGGGAKVDKGSETVTQANLGLRYVISLQGRYPSRD